MHREISFQNDPYDIEGLAQAFSKSFYFSIESIAQLLEINPTTKILVARISERFVGAMTYTVENRGSTLRVQNVEVLLDFRRNGIGPQLLLNAENISQDLTDDVMAIGIHPPMRLLHVCSWQRDIRERMIGNSTSRKFAFSTFSL